MDKKRVQAGLKATGLKTRNEDLALCGIIAATALEYHCGLLHNDKDFSPIERHLSLKAVNV